MDYEKRLDALVEKNENHDDAFGSPLDMAPRNITPKKTTAKKVLTRAESEEAKRVRLRKKVKGIFHFYEVPQGSLSFTYKEFKNDPLETYTFYDGEIREIPLGVALHLANSGKYPQYQYTKDQNGKVTTKIEKQISRYGFESLEFISSDEFNPELV